MSEPAVSTASALEIEKPHVPEGASEENKDSNPWSSREVSIHTEPIPIDDSFFTQIRQQLDPPEMSNNEINTSKYTLLTFLPVNLFLQFCRVANLYFLITAALQFIPGLSPTSWFTTVLPLAFVLIVNMIKEGYDDYHRHKSDAEINAREVLVLYSGGKEVPTPWKHVAVGNLVKVRVNEEVPADLVLLATSDDGGLCYIETANLDGETNLKNKNSFGATSGSKSADDLLQFSQSTIIHCEAPNARLYSFDGAVVSKVATTHPEPLTVDNLLLRGCTMRKTEWAIGVAVFTGADSKIMMNRTPSPRKVTQLERHMNILVIALFVWVFVSASFMAMGDQIWMATHPGEWFLQYTNSWPDLSPGFPSWIIQVIRFVILCNGYIPISLYITLEVIKVFQCVLVFNSDLRMYHRETDTRFNCRTTTLNEDLGQVEYVLSDKTGTLTQNVMGFVWASIGGELYKGLSAVQGGDGSKAGGQGGMSTAGSAGDGITVRNKSVQAYPLHVPERTPHSITLDENLQSRLGSHFAKLAGWDSSDLSNEPAQDVSRFLISLAVCNTVVPSLDDKGQLQYQASSPDEEALVQGAAYCGYSLLSRFTDYLEVSYHGQQYKYNILAVLEFNSDRKRMSLICRCPDGKIRLFCKGADTMIMARIKPNQAITQSVRRHLEEMALSGYRTLCIAERELSEEQFNQWIQQYKTASVALQDRERQLARVSESIEVDLELLGATAVEDKLQDGVPDAIESLIAAGIKVWVLTGDKAETAINIALSCRLFNSDMSIVELRERDMEGATTPEKQAELLQRKVEEVQSEVESTGVMCGYSNVGLVIEGGALAVFLDPEHQDKLVTLCSACKSVVCCRVSPMQKANVTKLVKNKLNAITLGIGDGANDVGMILAAHIGVGISGREGRAAVMSSDFSFAQFRFLSRLLLVHGRSSYKRNSEIILYSFYKNWVMNLTYNIFAFASAYSAQPLYTSGCIATLNVLWSSYVTVAYAVLEQDVAPQTVVAHPKLYLETMRFTRKQFLVSQVWYLCFATWHALVIYFVPMYSMWLPDSNGIVRDWVEVGCTMYMAIVIIINLKLAMKTRYWTWITHVMTWASIATLFLFYYLYGLVWPIFTVEGTADMSNIAGRIYPLPQFWLSGVLLAPIMSLLPDFICDAFQRLLVPKPFQIYQELEQKAELKSVALKELGLQSKPDQPTSPSNA